MKPRPTFGKLHPPEVHHISASSSPSPSGVATQLHGHIRSLAETLSSLPTLDQDVSLAILRLQCEHLANIKKLLQESSSSSSLSGFHNSAKDAFRKFDGFKISLRLLHGLKAFFSSDGRTRSRDERTAFFDIIQLVLEIISAATLGHAPNRKYFIRRLDKGGWFILATALEWTGITTTKDQDGLEILFGLLFNVAMGQDKLKAAFCGIEKSDKADEDAELQGFINEKFDQNDTLQIPEAINVIVYIWKIALDAHVEKSLMLAIPMALQRVQRASIRNQVLLHNISVLPTLLDIYTSHSRRIRQALKPVLDNLLAYGVPNLTDAYDLYRNATKSDEFADLVLKGMQTMPQFIHFDLSHCGFSSVELSSLGQPFPPASSTGYSIAMWVRLDEFDTQNRMVLFGAQDRSLTCNLLLFVDPSSRHLALQTATSSGPADGVRPTVFRSTRFTTDRWYHIVITHKKVRTGPMNTGSANRAALFVDGALVETVRCAYPATPPSIPSQPAVPTFSPPLNPTAQLQREKTPLFSRSSSSESFASLSLSGLQQSISAAASGALSNVSGGDPAPVSAFMGSPEGMMFGNRSSGFPKTKWSLATLHVLRDVLTEDFVRIMHGLGPRYSGNFQDVLGSFQTYGSAAAIHVVNEEQMQMPGRSDGQGQHPDRTELARSLSRPGNLVLPESKIAIGIWGQGVVNADSWECGDGDAPNISTNSEGVLMKNLGREATKTLHKLLAKDGNVASPGGTLVSRHTGVVLNAGVSDYNLAFVSNLVGGQPAGYALLTGSPPVFSPSSTSLADAAWRIAGCAPPLLKILSRASTKEQVLRAVAITFDALGVSWRNSEAVERENGYVVLAGVMREKLGFGSMFGEEFTSNSSTDSYAFAVPPHEREELALELLRMSLKFVGYSERDPEGSVLTNSMAYRGLLVEFDTWRKAPMATQKLYYAQFVRFAGSGRTGRFGRFNARRIVRMRLIKRFIDALKGETFTEDVFPDFLEAFNAVFKCTVSVDTLRAVPLFITYALQEHRAFPSYNSNTNFRPISAVSGKGKPSTALPFGNLLSNEGSFREIPRFEIGVRILDDFADILCSSAQDSGEELIKKFATSVTNKWLLHLLAERDSRVIVLSTKILARLLVVHGTSYVRNFADKNGGFAVLAKRLRSWWSIPALWMNLFAVLFNVDPAKIDYDTHSSEFNQFTLAEAFAPTKGQVSCKEVLPVMMRMLETGLRCVVQDTGDVESPVENKSPGPTTRPRSGSNLKMDTVVYPASAYDETNNVEVIHAVARFLADCHLRYPAFRDFAVGSPLVQELLFTVYPVVVTADPVSPETELMASGANKSNTGLNFEGQDVVVGPNSDGTSKQSVIRTAAIPAPTPPPQRPGVRHHRAASFRRPSSFILVTTSSDTNENKANTPHKPAARFHSIISPSGSASLTLRVGSNIVQTLLGIVTATSLDQVLYRKDFTGFSFCTKIPPGFQEHQAFFESHIHTLIMSELSNTIRMQEKLVFSDARVITNLHRYFLHVTEAVFEGWYIDGAEKLLDFLGQTLELLQRPDVAKLKLVRLCTQQIAMMRNTIQRVALFILAELLEDPPKDPSETVAFLEKLHYWQSVFLSPIHDETRFLRLLFYHLYIRIASGNAKVRAAVIQFWRVLLMHKHAEAGAIMREAVPSGQRYLANGFLKLVELDDEPFLVWVDHNRTELDGAFLSANGLAKYWEEHVSEENRRIEDSAGVRAARRRDQLKRWSKEEVAMEEIWRRHESQTTHWRNNVFASERIRHQKAIQDQQDTLIMAAATVDKFDRILEEPCGLFNMEMKKCKWQLDETEAQNRMRLRIVPDRKTIEDDYRPKRREQSHSKKIERQDTKDRESQIVLRENSNAGASPVIGQADGSGFGTRKRSDSRSSQQSGLDEYEIIEDPHRTEDGEFEDKNRKVTRTLQPKDVIQHVCNVSRIEGLEAIEGLLIIGKDCMYLIDHYFQRLDGEVVGVWQAPVEERDRYLRMISGRETSARKPRPGDRTRRHWRWADVLLISKRRFLLRDVALEIFFTDGRGYLLTSASPEGRNGLFARLIAKSPLVNNPSSSLAPEDLLRVEALRSPEDQPQSLGLKFASVFNAGASNPATRKWMRGELSNFAYLMQINTMAGRTFNDLTQYPVFPWVLADYESTELDLTNPLTFRDFSKPMGAQDPQRESAFRRRYEEVQSMSSDPPHHYGTHYSSAMTVCQYLMRLQPFVKSYLLLQGGNFDHPDRLFYSIAEAWISASNRNMSDVRELIPEFFYLPEFLVNLNAYNFGTRAGGESIDSVELPPWAHGDPNIFIQKHREALESPFVSANLHKWIDLVFGAKQIGEAAVDSVNVFHFLSYHGAVDLESIADRQEQLAAIGIIHNFGQTPRQVFSRPHPQRDLVAATKFTKENDLNAVINELTRGPSAVLDIRERVNALVWSARAEKVLATGPYAIAVPPGCEGVMKFGFADGSMRFFTAPTTAFGESGGKGKQVMHMEHIHAGGGISTALFVDGRTLVTAGRDGVVTLFNVGTSQQLQITTGNTGAGAGVVSKGAVESVSQRDALFGHRYPVTLLAASKALATLLSADTSGRVLMWDVNRGEFTREIAPGHPPPTRFADGRSLGGEESVRAMKICGATGEIVLCVGRTAKIISLNGRILANAVVASGEEEGVTSCAWYEGSGRGEWVGRILLLTGHKNGVVKIWTKSIIDKATSTSDAIQTYDPSLSFKLTLLRRLTPPGPHLHHGQQHVHAPPMLQEASRPAAVTAILARARCVYVGDELGRVFEWRAE